MRIWFRTFAPTAFLPDKRFQQAWAKIKALRQLLDLYDTEDTQLKQFKETYEIGGKHLSEMIKQRDELNIAIEELEAQMEWGRQMIASMEEEVKKA